MKTFIAKSAGCFAALVVASLLPNAAFSQTDAAAAPAAAPAVPVLHIQADDIKHKVSPTLYGIMTEEINYSYEGGLYAELIRNRSFQDTGRNNPGDHYWTLVKDPAAAGSMSVDTAQPLNPAHPVSLKLDATGATAKQPVGVANEGYWGIPVKPNTRYRASFYAKAAPGFTGPMVVRIESNDGSTVYASGEVSKISGEWKQYTVTLTTGKSVAPSVTNRFVIAATKPGTVWLTMVSLFPPTWNNRPNGLRPDIMQLLSDMKPATLRFPGGNYVEGKTVATRFDWKKTIGPVVERPGHRNDSWGYWSSDGMGLMEFLNWCEDLKMQPVLAVFAGLFLNGGGAQPIQAGPGLEPYVQDALDEIEYVTGDKSTKWGAQRAKDGHPAPFHLEYVEIGNEDNLSGGGPSYDGRFTQFYDAIKAKYPNLQLIATTTVRSRKPDVRDDHAYFSSSASARAAATKYDNTDRTNTPKIMFGEYASQTGGYQNNGRPATPNLINALDDAAFLTGLERNSDLVILSSYAPLFINMNPGGVQWRTDLIGYDALHSFGSVSYYLQVMWNNHLGDVVVGSSAKNIPTESLTTAARGGSTITQSMSSFFYSVTKDTKNGTLILKVINTAQNPQRVQIEIAGAKKIAAKGKATVLTSDSLTDGNSLSEPLKVVPHTMSVDGLGANFTREFAPRSVTILEIETK